MSTEVSTAVGRFVWHDLMTTDVGRAAEFYRGLFGWRIGGVGGAEGSSEAEVGWAGGAVGPYAVIVGPAGEMGGLAAFGPGLRAGAPGAPGASGQGTAVTGVPSQPAAAAGVPGEEAAVRGVPSQAAAAAGVPGEGAAPPGVPSQAAAAAGGPGQGAAPRGVPSQGMPVHGALAPGAVVASHWIGYVAVEDVDATVARAEGLGGRTRVAGSEIPGIGRFAVLEDPTGAVFSPFRPHAPMEAPGELGRVERPGTFVADQLLASDPRAAGEFYAELLGWTVVPQEIPGMGVWYSLRLATGREAAAMLPKPPGSGPSAWLPYVGVAAGGLDDAARRAVELGGALQVPPTALPRGRFAVAADPTGGLFGLLEGG
jgi:predicted enzyme related to lactoylglutathione lyase